LLHGHTTRMKLPVSGGGLLAPNLTTTLRLTWKHFLTAARAAREGREGGDGMDSNGGK
jgi:hypothetical protein